MKFILDIFLKYIYIQSKIIHIFLIYQIILYDNLAHIIIKNNI